MPRDDNLPSRRLVIHLLRRGVNPAELIDEKARLTQYEISLGGDIRGRMYVKEGRPKMPDWADFFEGEVPRGAFGRVASASAVLFVPARERWFALTFGHGRTLFPSESCQERFGLKVA